MPDPQRFLVGVHFRRHFGGPGHLTVSPGRLVLTDRKGTRTVTHQGTTVGVERKRWEPPTGNHWLAISDGETTAWATVSRTRLALIEQAMRLSGFALDRA